MHTTLGYCVCELLDLGVGDSCVVWEEQEHVLQLVGVLFVRVWHEGNRSVLSL